MMRRIFNFFRKLLQRDHKQDVFKELPQEMCLAILNELDYKNLTTVAKVNKKFLALVRGMPCYADLKKEMEKRKDIFVLQEEIEKINKNTSPNALYNFVYNNKYLFILMKFYNVICAGDLASLAVGYLFSLNYFSHHVTMAVGKTSALASAYLIGDHKDTFIPATLFITQAQLAMSQLIEAEIGKELAFKTGASMIAGTLVNNTWQFFENKVKDKRKQYNEGRRAIVHLEDKIHVLKKAL